MDAGPKSHHIESPGHNIDLEEVKNTRQKKFERGVKEATCNKVSKPRLNKDGGHYKLSGVYESILRSRP